ncbi:MAG: ABC transporter ATP-binding protein [Solirubrobacterales bacterium]
MPEAPTLAVEAVEAGYDGAKVLREVDLTVRQGEVVALLGRNGAGKTTLLKAIGGHLRPTAGAILIDGAPAPPRPFQRARAGITLIPEGRGVFPHLTVRENLRLMLPPWRRGESTDPALDMFPVLRKRLGQSAGTMSGGEQQMLALSRCVLAEPRVVLLDEVSMGLAPRVVETIFEALRDLAAAGTSLLLVEQYVAKALDLADSVLVLDRGRVVLTGTSSEIDEGVLSRQYLSVPDAS